MRAKIHSSPGRCGEHWDGFKAESPPMTQDTVCVLLYRWTAISTRIRHHSINQQKIRRTVQPNKSRERSRTVGKEPTKNFGRRGFVVSYASNIGSGFHHRRLRSSTDENFHFQVHKAPPYAVDLSRPLELSSIRKLHRLPHETCPFICMGTPCDGANLTTIMGSMDRKWNAFQFRCLPVAKSLEMRRRYSDLLPCSGVTSDRVLCFS